MSYIDGHELIFYDNDEEDIHSGGFSVNSIMMKAGMKPGLSPIMTINKEASLIGGNNVSDIFNGLVVPNWAFTQAPIMSGAGENTSVSANKKYYDSDEEDDYLDDELHNKLLDLVKHHDSQQKKTKMKLTRKQTKKMKGGTRKSRT